MKRPLRFLLRGLRGPLPGYALVLLGMMARLSMPTAHSHEPTRVASTLKDNLSKPFPLHDVPPPVDVAESIVESSVPEVAEVETPESVQRHASLATVKRAIALITTGCEKFNEIPAYSAKFRKLERLDGDLHNEQLINTHIRHAPFSVYMKWEEGDKNRQLIFVDGKFDGNLLVQPGGIAGRVTGVLKFDPDSEMARSDSRYSIREAGLLNLAALILSYQRVDVTRGQGFQCQMSEEEEDPSGRPTYHFTTTYESAEFNPLYRKAEFYIDKELSLPTCVRNYTWAVDADEATLDEDTLLEFFQWSEIEAEESSEETFDPTNKAYRMRM